MEKLVVDFVFGCNRYGALFRRCNAIVNKNGECWPAIPTMAKELKLSQSTIRRALRDLRKAGLLETEQRYRTKGGKSSLLYKLHPQ